MNCKIRDHKDTENNKNEGGGVGWGGIRRIMKGSAEADTNENNTRLTH